MAFICSCHAVNTRNVRDAIARGACTVEQIGEMCGAGTNCFGCHPTLETMLECEEKVSTAASTASFSGRRRRRRALTATPMPAT